LLWWGEGGGSNIFTPLQEESPRFEYLRAEIPKLQLSVEHDKDLSSSALRATQGVLNSYRRIVEADDEIFKARKEHLKARMSCI